MSLRWLWVQSVTTDTCSSGKDTRNGAIGKCACLVLGIIDVSGS